MFYKLKNIYRDNFKSAIYCCSVDRMFDGLGRLDSTSFERAAETSLADWVVARKKFLYKKNGSRKIAQREPPKRNTRMLDKSKRADHEKKKICSEKYMLCSPPLKDFMVHSYFKKCSRASLQQNLFALIPNGHADETCSLDRISANQ